MPRVVGIDPGTISLDMCGLDRGRVFLDRSISTRDALADPALLIGLLEEAGPLDLIAGPSGYGLPVTAIQQLSDADLRLAFLAPGEASGGIGGLSSFLRALGRTSLPVVMTPGVIHLASVPDHRKANRVDMGTADKVCAVVLAVHQAIEKRRCHLDDVSFVLLELGGAFSAAIAVDGGRIVDGLGGSSGPLGAAASGALDAEVAFLAGTVTKELVFAGGALAIAGTPGATADTLTTAVTPAARLAWEAYLESAVKAVLSLTVSVPGVSDVLLSGRLAGVAGVREALARRLSTVMTGASVEVLTGFASVAKHAAQGAALLADGLAGGTCAAIVDRLGVREAKGTVLDHLFVISPQRARQRLGLA